MATATWIKHELDGRGLDYEELHHEDAFTAQALAQQEHVSGHQVAKVVLVLADGQPVELILPASRRVVLDCVREQLAARAVRLATEVELQDYFADCEPGAIPALRHENVPAVLMDDSLRAAGIIVFQGGTHRDAVRMRFDDWFEMVRPRVERFSEPGQ